eukprot:4810582-Amphidinium_carterae.1
MDAFFYRTLRRILKIPASFVDRAWTNERVFDTARHFIVSAKGVKAARNFTSFSVSETETESFGASFALGSSRPYAYTFTPEGTDLTEHVHRRVGRPRISWLWSVATDHEMSMRHIWVRRNMSIRKFPF